MRCPGAFERSGPSRAEKPDHTGHGCSSARLSPAMQPTNAAQPLSAGQARSATKSGQISTGPQPLQRHQRQDDAFGRSGVNRRVPMPQAVIFDVDGTLVDSVDQHAQAWVDAFRDYGHELAFADVRSQIGKGGDQLTARGDGRRKEPAAGTELPPVTTGTVTTQSAPHSVGPSEPRWPGRRRERPGQERHRRSVHNAKAAAAPRSVGSPRPARASCLGSST